MDTHNFTLEKKIPENCEKESCAYDVKRAFMTISRSFASVTNAGSGTMALLIHQVIQGNLYQTGVGGAR